MLPNVKIKSNSLPRPAEILIDDKPLEGIRRLDVRMRIDEIVTITAELIPELIELEYKAPDIFILIGDRKFKLLECVGDAECTQEN